MADGLENSRHPPFHSCRSLSLDVKITSLSPPLLHVMDGRMSRADVSPLPWHLSYHTTCAAANGVLPFGKVHSGITSRPERRSRCLSLYLTVISVSLVGETRAGGRVSTADMQMKLFKWDRCHICEREEADCWECPTQNAGHCFVSWHSKRLFCALKRHNGLAKCTDRNYFCCLWSCDTSFENRYFKWGGFILSFSKKKNKIKITIPLLTFVINRKKKKIILPQGFRRQEVAGKYLQQGSRHDGKTK